MRRIGTLVREARTQLTPAVFGSLPNVHTYVTGDAAFSVT